MSNKEIEQQIKAIGEHLQDADEGRHVTGSLIIAIQKLVEINEGLLKRLNSAERSLYDLLGNRE